MPLMNLTSIGEIRRYAATDLIILKSLCQAMINLDCARVNSSQQQTRLHKLKLIKRSGEENLSYQDKPSLLIR